MSATERQDPSLRHITVRRTARYALIGAPSENIRDVWIVCHGHAQLALRFIERFRQLEHVDRLIVAPEALNRYYLESGFHGPESRVGATWMTTEDREREIADYIGYLDELHTEIFSVVRRERCVLRVLGFSQGVATAARWVAAGKGSPNELILWAGSLPVELDAVGAARFNRYGRPVRIVVGDRDQFITSKVVQEQVAKLHGLGVTVEVTTFPGGHDLDPPTLVRIAEEDLQNRG